MLRNTIGIALIFFSFSLYVNTALAEISKNREAEIIKLIEEDCSRCHGPNLEGNIGPPLMQYNLRHLPDEYIYNTIKNGRRNSFMPSWMGFLNKEEINWIVRWLKSDKDLP